MLVRIENVYGPGIRKKAMEIFNASVLLLGLRVDNHSTAE